MGKRQIKCISIINGSQWSWRVKKGDWFSVVKDEANLIHERGGNGAVWAGGGGRAPFSACVSSISWFVGVTVEVQSSEVCAVCICSVGV